MLCIDDGYAKSGLNSSDFYFGKRRKMYPIPPSTRGIVTRDLVYECQRAAKMEIKLDTTGNPGKFGNGAFVVFVMTKTNLEKDHTLDKCKCVVIIEMYGTWLHKIDL